MSKRATILVLVVCAAVVAAAVGMTRGASAAAGTPSVSPWTEMAASGAAEAPVLPGAQRIVVTERDGEFTYIDADNSGTRSRGDYFVTSSNLFDAGGSRVGRDWVRCMVTVHASQCEATFELFGRGSIDLAGTITDRSLIAVTGGTGEFGDAGGQLGFGSHGKLIISLLHLS
jgi:hypothetical protein